MQRKFFRMLFQSDPGVTAEAAARLTEACATEIAQVRVRLPMVVRRAGKPADVPSAKGSPPGETETAPAAAFDPHAFSLIVVMRTGGEDALSARLSQVADIHHLRAIASAQHVALDPQITDRPAITAAIIDGTARRIAHRHAAAS